MCKFKKEMISLILVLILILPLVSTIAVANGYPSDLFYVGRDLTTQGDWVKRGYGDCGYALPFAEVETKEVAVGVTTGIGEPAHEFWWREPWSIPGEKYYPYEDYLGGKKILKYEVIGPEGAPRPLVNSSLPYYRPTWYNSSKTILITLSLTGDYRVALYFLDWELPHEKIKVNVTSGVSWDAVELGAPPLTENFAGGIYAKFDVHSDGIITINVTKISGNYAVISGIFLDKISPVSGVSFTGFDNETKGNWRPTYGNDYYLLCGFNAPTGNNAFDKDYDETNLVYLTDYTVSDGVNQYAADDARTYGEYPYIGHYAAYAWTDTRDPIPTDPRVLVYPTVKLYHGYPPPLDGRIYGQWDSGEMGYPLNYFIIKLEIPKGKYLLSVYAMDFEEYGRSETIEVWDENMNTLLDSQYITADEINNGIYLKWYVKGPQTINIKVIADQGNLNSFLDGIFLNCLKVGGETLNSFVDELILNLNVAIENLQFPFFSIKLP
ncbi:hypothetical protein CW703_02525 [Candidatus Bathyarchaeota archaeon]|nr:MAG: hypothetical protein CW703_02525 [Candidatus Bathyarchaeota archaeon]